MHRMIRCAAGAAALLFAGAAPSIAAPNCNLGNGIKHIVYLQFDNVHLRRDNPNVPSDLEQIPSLLNFMTRNGTLLTNHHTPLISHTSVDIVTSLTGVYGENSASRSATASASSIRPGVRISRPRLPIGLTSSTRARRQVRSMFRRRRPARQDPSRAMGPFTRAGCDVGAFSIANLELENTGIGGTGIPPARHRHRVRPVVGGGCGGCGCGRATERPCPCQGESGACRRLRGHRHPLRTR